MMDDLLLHPQTKAQVYGFLSQPSHAVLIEGRIGSGKMYLARYIMSSLLGIPADKLHDYPHKLIISRLPDKSEILIDQIRDVPQFVKLKLPKTNSDIVRVVCIEDAHTMNQEAQNALLKTLEEAPTDTVIVLTATRQAALLPTITSRVSTISVQPISQKQAAKGLHYPKDQVERAYYMSGGRIGLLHALLEHDNHELVEYIDYSKDILTKNTFERLVGVDEFIKSKKNVDILLESLYIIAHSGLQGAASKNDAKAVKRWLRIKKSVINLQSTQNSHPSAKLTLDNLMLSI